MEYTDVNIENCHMVIDPVYLRIISATDEFLTVERIMARTGLDRVEVEDGCQVLVEKGFLKRKGFQYKSEVESFNLSFSSNRIKLSLNNEIEIDSPILT